MWRSDFHEPLNLGSDRLVAVNELVDIVAKIVGKRSRRRQDLGKPQGERGRNSANSQLTRPPVGVSLLGVDGEVGGGIRSHVHHLARALAARRDETYIFFVPRRLERRWRELLPETAVLVSCLGSGRLPELRVFYESMILPWVARRSGCRVLFYPNAIAPASWVLPCVVTIHDLMYLSQRTYFSWRKRKYWNFTYRQLARSRVRLVTISQFTRHEVHTRLGVPFDRIVPIVSGVDDAFFGSPPGGRLAEVPHEPYLLAVSAAYPHKRLPLLIAAFEQIAATRERLFLVLAGTHIGQRQELARLDNAIENSAVRNRIVRLGPMPWTEMPRLYSHALALVQASAYEGYGLPVAEAMAAGLPVIAAPAAATLEILNGWGEVAQGWCEQDLVGAIERTLEWSTDARARQGAGARETARTRYRWSRVAEFLAQEFAKIGTC